MSPQPQSPLSPLAEQYCRGQETAVAGNLEKFLEGCPELEVAQLLELLLVDQALRWQQGWGPSVEEYLRRFPPVAAHQQAVLELVYGEMRARRTGGLPIDGDSFATRFPDLAEPLRRQLELSAWLTGDGDARADPPEV